jgi:hypothetical protein
MTNNYLTEVKELPASSPALFAVFAKTIMRSACEIIDDFCDDKFEDIFSCDDFYDFTIFDEEKTEIDTVALAIIDATRQIIEELHSFEGSGTKMDAVKMKQFSKRLIEQRDALSFILFAQEAHHAEIEAELARVLSLSALPGSSQEGLQSESMCTECKEALESLERQKALAQIEAWKEAISKTDFANRSFGDDEIDD